MPILSASGLRKSYGDLEVVAGVDIRVEPGECFGLLGPNGAGKTTTLRLLLGLIEPDAGDMSVLGFAIPRQARQARQRIGVAPQFDSLDPDFTVTENLLVYGRYFGTRVQELRTRITPLLEQTGLAHKADARVPTLSGGMKRRLTLARALVNDPDVLFLDEPTTGLDPQARHLMWQSLRRLLNQGKTILLTTHFMEEAQRLCDRLSVMDHGHIIATGSPRELIERHIEPQVVELYGEGAVQWVTQYGSEFCQRHESAGESVFCYTRAGDALVRHLQNHEQIEYMHRPANLEDVFLKLTGRELRD
ncbi:MAG: ATP-binding cassette domain-containing protein [Burkholderiales bacterium]